MQRREARVQTGAIATSFVVSGVDCSKDWSFVFFV